MSPPLTRAREKRGGFATRETGPPRGVRGAGRFAHLGVAQHARDALETAQAESGVRVEVERAQREARARGAREAARGEYRVGERGRAALAHVVIAQIDRAERDDRAPGRDLADARDAVVAEAEAREAEVAVFLALRRAPHRLDEQRVALLLRVGAANLVRVGVVAVRLLGQPLRVGEVHPISQLRPNKFYPCYPLIKGAQAFS